KSVIFPLVVDNTKTDLSVIFLPFTIGYKTKISNFSKRVKLLSEEISENLRLSSSSEISPKRTFGNIGYLSETEIPDFPFKTALIFDCTSNPKGVMQFVSEIYTAFSITKFPFFVSTFRKIRDCSTTKLRLYPQKPESSDLYKPTRYFR